MEAIKAYYAKLNNMGDLLSEYLIPYCTGKSVEHCENVANFQIMGVGSCGGAIWGGKEVGLKEKIKDSIKSGLCKTTSAPCAVWGTGFLKDYYPSRLTLLRKNVSFIAVRGALSQRIIENSLGKKINPVLCDGGILSAELLSDIPQKKYSVGFIPHYNEQKLVAENGLLKAMSAKYGNMTVINLREDPLTVIKHIGECEIILSTSLHGCVVADSFGIPNMRVTISQIPGTGFKFDDYYSGYGLEIPGLKLSAEMKLPELRGIVDNYKISHDMVEEKKEGIRQALVDFVKCL